jgi:hypothetical protein
LSERFIADLQADWEQHGVKVIERVRRSDPVAYLRTVALMVRPVHHAGVEDNSFRDLSDDELRFQPRVGSRDHLRLKAIASPPPSI